MPQILEITQKGIRDSILVFSGNKKWGDYDTYDIVVNRVGTGFDDTEYSVIAEPHSKLELDEKQKEKVAGITLEALYENKDPFSKDSAGAKKDYPQADYPEDEINERLPTHPHRGERGRVQEGSMIINRLN